MESQKLFPKEIIDLSSEVLLASRVRPSNAIYLILVLSLIALVGLLPFLFIEVSVKSPGLLRAATEVNDVKATSAGIVKEVFVRENSKVIKGQLLLEVQSPMLEEKEHYLGSKVREESQVLKDLDGLTDTRKSGTNIISEIVTPLYRQSLTDYLQKLVVRQAQFRKVKQDYERNKRLYDEGVIATADFENYEFDLEKAQTDLDLQKQSQLNVWHQELSSHEKQLADYKNQLIQTQHERAILNIRAPITGSIQNLAGIYAGSPVFSNQDVAQISPDNYLIAVVNVSPHDIGLLHEGMEVRMQISAFNHNQWGLLKGKVIQISNDIRLKNNQPVFEILCSLNQDHLSLKNGYQGKLRKGMTLQAGFVVIERSLWQLLYDKVDDWMNPNIMH